MEPVNNAPGAQEVPIVVDGRTEAEWCREACRVGAYDCVGPDGRHIRTFTGERTREKVAATIQGLKAQAERYDRALGVKTCEHPGCTSPALPLFKFCRPHAADAAHNNGMDLS